MPRQLAEEKEVGRFAAKRRRWRGIEGRAKKRNRSVPKEMRRWRRITSQFRAESVEAREIPYAPALWIEGWGISDRLDG